MSSIRRFRPAARRLLPAFALAALVLVLPACSSDSEDDTGPVDITTVLELLLGSGMDVRGLQVDLTFDPSMQLIGLQPVGQFSGQTCESTIGSNFADFLCARDSASTFDAPQTLWRLSFEHSSAVNPEDLILSLDCLASDSLGNTFPVACDLE